MTDYSKDLVKKYKHWEVYVHPNQSYLGRLVIWCTREDALDLAGTSIEEQVELFLILQDLKIASGKLFQPDWFNYLFLGNATRHLHCHFIPRYSQPINFMDIEFKDKSYGSDYEPDVNFITSPELLIAIRDKYREILR